MEQNKFIEMLNQSIASSEFKNIWGKLTVQSKNNKEILLKDREEYGWSLFNSYSSFFESCIQILTDREDGKKFREIASLLKKIDENLREIAELKEKHFIAPESSWNPLVDTQKEIEEDIDDLLKENEKYKQKIDVYKNSILENFCNHGIELDRSQLDFMISSAMQEKLASLLLVTDTMKQILFSIEKQMVEGGDHIVVKNYASVYLVSILTLRHTQDLAIEDLENNAKRIDTLIQLAQNNIYEACTIPGHEFDRTLQSNIKLNERSIEISKVYKEILLNFSKQLVEGRPALDRNIKVARNLYNTVETANNLITVIKKTSADYSSLFKFAMPKINQLYASNMTTEFDKISAKLRELAGK